MEKYIIKDGSLNLIKIIEGYERRLSDLDNIIRIDKADLSKQRANDDLRNSIKVNKAKRQVYIQVIEDLRDLVN